MRTILFILLLLGSVIARGETSTGTGPSWYPRFSWDTVPVYQMFGSPQLLTDEEVNTIAASSDFICIEKAHGLKTLGAAELGAIHDDLQPLIARDPQIGELAHKDQIYALNVLNPEFRSWWTETVANAVRETGADGLFVDQMHGNV